MGQPGGRAGVVTPRGGSNPAPGLTLPSLVSPGTTADLIRSSSGDEATQSPLRVGDDFQTMARKMLPFEVGAPEAAAAPEPAAPEPAAPEPAAAGAAAGAESSEEQEAVAAGRGDAAAAGGAEVSGEAVAAA